MKERKIITIIILNEWTKFYWVNNCSSRLSAAVGRMHWSGSTSQLVECILFILNNRSFCSSIAYNIGSRKLDNIMNICKIKEGISCAKWILEFVRNRVYISYSIQKLNEIDCRKVMKTVRIVHFQVEIVNKRWIQTENEIETIWNMLSDWKMNIEICIHFSTSWRRSTRRGSNGNRRLHGKWLPL